MIDLWISAAPEEVLLPTCNEAELIYNVKGEWQIRLTDINYFVLLWVEANYAF